MTGPIPTNVVEDLSWMDRANCRGTNGFTELDVAEQIPYCQHCKVRSECLEFGKATKSSAIVFGGKQLQAVGGRP